MSKPGQRFIQPKIAGKEQLCTRIISTPKGQFPVGFPPIGFNFFLISPPVSKTIHVRQIPYVFSDILVAKIPGNFPGFANTKAI